MSKIYDYVIVGSGLGGLVCAAVIAKKGYSVCVLEKNRQFGGSLQIFSRDKRIFDTGVHYVGGLSKGENLYKVFKFLGIMDDLKLKKLDEDAFDVITFLDESNVEYKLSQGYEKFKSTLLEKFPDEEKSLIKYCQDLQNIVSDFPLFNLEIEDNFSFSDAHNTSVSKYLEELTNDEKLRAVLAGTNILYAGERDKTPLYVHALIMHSYIGSAWKFVNGGAQIEKALVKVIRENGGVLRNHSEVVRISCEDSKVSHVVLNSGDEIWGEKFISNAHPAQTLKMFDCNPFRKSYSNRISNLENTTSTFVLYISMKDNTFKYVNSNQYLFQTMDVWKNGTYSQTEWPHELALYSNVNSENPDYTDGIIVVAYMRYEEVEKWASTFKNIPKFDTSRSQSYEEFKEEKSKLILSKIEKKYPGFGSKINSYSSSTPLTYRDYIGNSDGSLYGVSKDYTKPLESFISPKTKVKNLFFTGQNVKLHGVLGVSISALTTLSCFFDIKELLKEINDAQEAD